MTKLEIPKTDAKMNKRNEVAFMQAYGKSYRQMKKEELAQMIMNQSMNVVKYREESYKIVKIALAIKRQRDWFLKLCRQKNGKRDS